MAAFSMAKPSGFRQSVQSVPIIRCQSAYDWTGKIVVVTGVAGSHSRIRFALVKCQKSGMFVVRLVFA